MALINKTRILVVSCSVEVNVWIGRLGSVVLVERRVDVVHALARQPFVHLWKQIRKFLNFFVFSRMHKFFTCLKIYLINIDKSCINSKIIWNNIKISRNFQKKSNKIFRYFNIVIDLRNFFLKFNIILIITIYLIRINRSRKLLNLEKNNLRYWIGRILISWKYVGFMRKLPTWCEIQ